MLSLPFRRTDRQKVGRTMDSSPDADADVLAAGKAEMGRLEDGAVTVASGSNFSSQGNYRDGHR